MDVGIIDPLLLLIFFSPILFIGLYFVIYSFPDYSTSNDISLAGTRSSPRRNLFMLLFSLYGLAIVYLGTQFYMSESGDLFLKVMGLVIIINGLVTVLVGLIPKDKSKILHDIVSYSAFILLSLSYIFGVIYFMRIEYLPLILIASFNLTILFLLGWRTLIWNKFDMITWKLEWSSLFLSIIYLFMCSLYLYFF